MISKCAYIWTVNRINKNCDGFYLFTYLFSIKNKSYQNDISKIKEQAKILLLQLICLPIFKHVFAYLRKKINMIYTSYILMCK